MIWLYINIYRAVWRAYVHPTTGHIYFLHIPTNYKQDMVPPGFADSSTLAMNSNVVLNPLLPISSNINNVSGTRVTGYFPPLSLPNSNNNSNNNSFDANSYNSMEMPDVSSINDTTTTTAMDDVNLNNSNDSL